MALGFIKKIFSFGKDDKSAVVPDPEVVREATPVVTAEELPPTTYQETESATQPVAEELVLDPVTVEHLGDRLIVPDVIIPDDLEHFRNDQLAELREQAESVAEFNETVEQESAPAIIPPDEPGIDGIDAHSEEAEAEAEAVAEQEPTAEAEIPSEQIADTSLVIELAIVNDTPVAPAVQTMEDEPVSPVAELEIEPDPEPATQAEAEAVPVAEDAALKGPVEQEATEPEPDVDQPASEPAPALEQPRAAPVLPAGFSSTSDRIEPEPITAERKLSWIERLRQGLSRTSAQLTSQITSLFTKRKLDDETLQDLEDLLIQADLGVETALRITDALASERYGKDVSGEDVSKIMASEITKVLAPVARPLELDLNHKPHVILVVGVNGTGKTTTIGKLAAKLTRGGLKVMLAAGDTFRAAAIEQLNIWASRTGADIVSSKLGADAAGLAYEAYEKAKQAGHDVLIIDTAGRLQNKTELMAELEKIVRVLGRLDPDAPHTVLQTLDATTGQNALNQVEIFRNVAGVSGLIMTKLDGTARGGILVAISAKHKLPVCFIGVGEGVEDLEPFNAKDFAEAIAGIQNK
jgi:fused signal recognition particle receptor